MTNLKSLRDEVDQIDDQIFELLVKRFDVAQQIAAIKSQAGDPPLDESRWQEIEQRIKSQAEQSGINSDDTAKIYQAIHQYVLTNIYRS